MAAAARASATPETRTWVPTSTSTSEVSAPASGTARVATPITRSCTRPGDPVAPRPSARQPSTQTASSGVPVRQVPSAIAIAQRESPEANSAIPRNSQPETRCGRPTVNASMTTSRMAAVMSSTGITTT